jgi:hypothetical protein
MVYIFTRNDGNYKVGFVHSWRKGGIEARKNVDCNKVTGSDVVAVITEVVKRINDGMLNSRNIHTNNPRRRNEVSYGFCHRILPVKYLKVCYYI